MAQRHPPETVPRVPQSGDGCLWAMGPGGWGAVPIAAPGSSIRPHLECWRCSSHPSLTSLPTHSAPLSEKGGEPKTGASPPHPFGTKSSRNALKCGLAMGAPSDPSQNGHDALKVANWGPHFYALQGAFSACARGFPSRGRSESFRARWQVLAKPTLAKKRGDEEGWRETP